MVKNMYTFFLLFIIIQLQNMVTAASGHLKGSYGKKCKKSWMNVIRFGFLLANPTAGVDQFKDQQKFEIIKRNRSKYRETSGVLTPTKECGLLRFSGKPTLSSFATVHLSRTAGEPRIA